MLHTDASSDGLCAILEQEHDNGLFHPIAYASRTLSKHEKRYGITDMEPLGVVWAAKHFRAYLLGHDCTVFTDHAPLKPMLKAKHQTGKLARWAAVISELNLDIQHRPGKKNSNADALVRPQGNRGSWLSHTMGPIESLMLLTILSLFGQWTNLMNHRC